MELIKSHNIYKFIHELVYIIPHDFTRKAVLTHTTPAKKPIDKHLDFIESQLLLNEILKRLDKGLSYSLLLLGLTSGMRFAEMVG